MRTGNVLGRLCPSRHYGRPSQSPGPLERLWDAVHNGAFDDLRSKGACEFRRRRCFTFSTKPYVRELCFNWLNVNSTISKSGKPPRKANASPDPATMAYTRTASPRSLTMKMDWRRRLETGAGAGSDVVSIR